MFMIVTYPWPVPAAHVELTGPQLRDASDPTPSGRRGILRKRSARATGEILRARTDESIRVGQPV